MGGTQPSDDLEARRAGLEEAMSAQPWAPVVRVDWIDGEAFSGADVAPEDVVDDVVLLILHGGGFRVGSARSWLPYTTRLAAAASRRCVIVDYPLAPEHPYPAAVDHAAEAFSWLERQGARVVVVGDSAGGNLAAALALRSSDAHAGTVLFSPWLDLRIVNDSYDQNAATDALFSRESAQEAAGFYAVGVDVDDPRVSPLLGDWAGQPPVLLETSSIEVLRDDARNLALRLIAAGVRVWFREVPGQPHDWHIAHPPTQATRDSFRMTRAFLDML